MHVCAHAILYVRICVCVYVRMHVSAYADVCGWIEICAMVSHILIASIS